MRTDAVKEKRKWLQSRGADVEVAVDGHDHAE